MTQTHSSCPIVLVIFKVHISDARLFLDDQMLMIDYVTHIALMLIGWWCIFNAWKQKVRIDASSGG